MNFFSINTNVLYAFLSKKATYDVNVPIFEWQYSNTKPQIQTTFSTTQTKDLLILANPISFNLVVSWWVAIAGKKQVPCI